MTAADPLAESIRMATNRKAIAFERRRAVRELAKSSDERALRTLGELFTDDDPYFRREVVQVAGRSEAFDPHPLLIQALNDKHDYVRQDAIASLVQRADSRTLAALEPLRSDSSFMVRMAVEQALKTLSSQFPEPPAPAPGEGPAENVKPPETTARLNEGTEPDSTQTSTRKPQSPGASVEAPPEHSARTEESTRPRSAERRPDRESAPTETTPDSADADRSLATPKPPSKEPAPAPPAPKEAPGAPTAPTTELETQGALLAGDLSTAEFDAQNDPRFSALFSTEDCTELTSLYQALENEQKAIAEVSQRIDGFSARRRQIQDQTGSEIERLTQELADLKSQRPLVEREFQSIEQQAAAAQGHAARRSRRLLGKLIASVQEQDATALEAARSERDRVQSALESLVQAIASTEEQLTSHTTERTKIAAKLEAAEHALRRQRAQSRVIDRKIDRAIQRRMQQLASSDAENRLQRFERLTRFPAFFRDCVAQWTRHETEMATLRTAYTAARRKMRRSADAATGRFADVSDSIVAGFHPVTTRQKASINISGTLTPVEAAPGGYSSPGGISARGSATLQYELPSLEWETPLRLSDAVRRFVAAWERAGIAAADRRRVHALLAGARRFRDENIRFVRAELEQGMRTR